jgi:hypothetical protein
MTANLEAQATETGNASSKEELGGNSTDSFRATPTCALDKIRTVSIAPPTLTSDSLQRGQHTRLSGLLRSPKLSVEKAAPSTKVVRRTPANHPTRGWKMVAPIKAAGCPSRYSPIRRASKGSQHQNSCKRLVPIFEVLPDNCAGHASGGSLRLTNASSCASALRGDHSMSKSSSYFLRRRAALWNSDSFDAH